MTEVTEKQFEDLSKRVETLEKASAEQGAEVKKTADKFASTVHAESVSRLPTPAPEPGQKADATQISSPAK